MRALFFAFAPNPGGKPTLVEPTFVGADFVGDPAAAGQFHARLGFALALGVWGRAVGRHPRRSGSTVARERVPLARPCLMADAPSHPSRRAGFSIRLLPQRKRPAVHAGPLTGLFARRSSVPQVATRVAADGSSGHGGVV